MPIKILQEGPKMLQNLEEPISDEYIQSKLLQNLKEPINDEYIQSKMLQNSEEPVNDDYMQSKMIQNLEEPISDDYIQSIEFSNSCRQFYLNRVKVSESHKQQLQKYEEKEQEKDYDPSKKSSMQNAMESLRKEMASLMDQDLSLMKQLLTLNETIEELKSKRLNRICKDFERTSSRDLTVSEESVSGTFFMNRSISSFETNPDDSNIFTCEIQSREENHTSECLYSHLTVKTACEGDEDLVQNIESFHKAQLSNDSGYEESGSDIDYTGTTL